MGLLLRPVGVVAGACPFNFPAMIPMWMFPIVIACGNTFMLKPSEKCPLSATRMAEILLQGGLPEGVLNVVQGDRETFEDLIGQPRVDAVSFVGSSPATRNVWRTAAFAATLADPSVGAPPLPPAQPAQHLNPILS